MYIIEQGKYIEIYDGELNFWNIQIKYMIVFIKYFSFALFNRILRRL